MQHHDSGKYEENMRFEVVATLNIRIVVLWDVTQLSLVDVNRRELRENVSCLVLGRQRQAGRTVLTKQTSTISRGVT
jgi:hypothetical protein